MANPDNNEPNTLDPSAWLDQYGDYLYRYALSRLRDAEAAEEVVQETFVAGLRAHDQFAGKGTEKAWLSTILRRKIVDFVRRRMRATPTDSESTDDVTEVLFDNQGKWRVDPRIFGAHPHAVLEKREFWDVFRKCLAGLPSRQADVFSLREMDDISSKQICKDLGITSSNLWVLLYRARLGLAKCMQHRWRESGEP